jgi:UDP-glucose 4-epimerase
MNLTNKKILVTGGAGFIGSHLVDALIQEDCYVRVFDNLSNGKLENLIQHKDNNHFKFVKGDVTEPSEVADAMESIDIVFHLACLGVRHSIKHPFENHRINAEGTMIVLQEAYKKSVEKFIYCSSSEVYGTAAYVPMPESHPTFPCTVYGASKLAGEVYSRAYHKTYGLNTIIIRPFNTFGPRSHHEADAGEIIPKSIVRALNGAPILIFGNGSQTRDFTYVEDVARALVESARFEEMIGLTLNVGSNFEISIKKIVEKILEMIEDSSSRIDYIKNRPGDVLRLCADVTAFNRLTDWKPRVSFEKGLQKTIQWFRSRPHGAKSLLNEEKGINWE